LDRKAGELLDLLPPLKPDDNDDDGEQL